MPLNVDSKEKMFLHEIKDLYSAENQIIDSLPKVIKALNSEEAKQALSAHLEETKKQASRLEQIAEQLESSANGVKCVGMEGLLKEADEVLAEDEMPTDVRTEALLTGSQKVEHYEIVGYQSAIKGAKELGYQQAISLLQHSLDEEKKALTKLEDLVG